MIRCREIGAADLDAIAELLTRGFAGRSRNYWLGGLARQAAREVPAGYPRFGYMLDREGTPVGVLLLIHSAREDDGTTVLRCNLSSWYVEPAFRNYAPMLTKIAQRHKEITYINISPASWTWRIIEAQGFQAYCSGLFVSFPALSRRSRDMTIEIVSRHVRELDRVPASQTALLARHAALGCLSLICRAADGSAFPFILQPMRIRRGQLAPPAMQLIYCHDIADYIACAGTIGRFLLWRGKIAVVLDANQRIDGLTGFYTEVRGRKYFKGPHCPRLGDLSDTELVIYGP
ncbi:MAG TPA: acyl-CoA acyltransferase [Bradyrhizobium sp.]|nr:acyl-CoA acyltransferase [Bradyrhizobium sp.]